MNFLGEISVGIPMALAPMAGVTNAPFRKVCRGFAQKALAEVQAERANLGAIPFERSEEEKTESEKAYIDTTQLVKAYSKTAHSQNAQLEKAQSGTEVGEEGKPQALKLAESAIGKDLFSADAPAGIYVCEMITARALVEGRATTLSLVKPDPEEKCRSVQLHGVDPRTMQEAAKILVALGLADHLDMNFGCPVPKVTRKGGGSALPWKLGHYEKIVSAVVKGAKQGEELRHEIANGVIPVSIEKHWKILKTAHKQGVALENIQAQSLDKSVPVSVKFRIGIDDDHLTYRDAGLVAQEVGASALCLHARTAGQYYSGCANWDKITDLVSLVDIPVWGNGDIFSYRDAKEMLETTGCAGIEVGRGVQGRPWLFYDLAAGMLGSKRRYRPSLEEVCRVIMEHAQELATWMGEENRALRDMRKHIGWYLRGFAVGGNLRAELSRINDLQGLENLLSQLDGEQPYPEAAEGRRGRAGHARKTHLPEGWLDSREIDGEAAKILAHAELDTFLDEGGY